MHLSKSLFLILLYSATAVAGWAVYENVHNGMGLAEVKEFVDDTLTLFDDRPAAELHRWRDGQGHWVYGSQPPPAAYAKPAITQTPAAHPATPHKLAGYSPAPHKQEAHRPDDGIPTSIADVYSVERITQLIKDAKNVENLLRDRKEAIDRAIADQTR